MVGLIGRVDEQMKTFYAERGEGDTVALRLFTTHPGHRLHPTGVSLVGYAGERVGVFCSHWDEAAAEAYGVSGIATLSPTSSTEGGISTPSYSAHLLSGRVQQEGSALSFHAEIDGVETPIVLFQGIGRNPPMVDLSYYSGHHVAVAVKDLEDNGRAFGVNSIGIIDPARPLSDQ